MSFIAANTNSPGLPPFDQERVVSRLLENFEALPPQLQTAARFIIDNPHEVGVQSMRTLASEIGIHPNSFTRLAREIGFSGYEEMRERFRDFVRTGTGSSNDRIMWLRTLSRSGGSAEVLGNMASACLDNTEQMFKNQKIKQLDQAVDTLLGARRVYILGLGLAYSLAYNFWYLAQMAFDHFYLIPNQGLLLSDELLHLGKQDCLVGMTFQPYRQETIQAIKRANQYGAKTIAITDSIAASAYREAHIGLHSPTHTPHFFQSNSAVSALIETLAALLVIKGGDKAEVAIDRFNTSRWNAEVYEST